MYRVQVLRDREGADWEGYGTYFTLQEALGHFHRLETHEGVANVRILKDEQETGIRAR